MGIINVNDDSFYSQSRVRAIDDFERKAELMLSEGADILDIGPCSSRPGAVFPDVEEEWRRLAPALELIRRRFPSAVISIDTFRHEIVRRSYDMIGNFIVNDITAGDGIGAEGVGEAGTGAEAGERTDAEGGTGAEAGEMLHTVGRLGLKYIAMHLRGGISAMHRNYHYDDVVAEVVDYFKRFDARAAAAGVHDYIIDPGFGFSKNTEDNYKLFGGLWELKSLGKPILVGISRKSMIYKPLGTTPEEALSATSALHLQALLQGADILRVHDVREARQCVKLFEMMTYQYFY